MPSYNKFENVNDGTVYLDLSGDTVSQDVVLNGIKFHASDGKQYTGNANYLTDATVSNQKLTITKSSGATVDFEGTKVSASQEGTSTTMAKYITIDGNEYKLASEPETYIKNASVADNKLTLTKQDDTTVEFQGGSADAVKYSEQTLTEAQQMQARKNQGLYYEMDEWNGIIDHTYLDGELTHVSVDCYAYGSLQLQMTASRVSPAMSSSLMVEEGWTGTVLEAGTVFNISWDEYVEDKVYIGTADVGDISTANALNITADGSYEFTISVYGTTATIKIENAKAGLYLIYDEDADRDEVITSISAPTGETPFITGSGSSNTLICYDYCTHSGHTTFPMIQYILYRIHDALTLEQMQDYSWTFADDDNDPVSFSFGSALDGDKSSIYEDQDTGLFINVTEVPDHQFMPANTANQNATASNQLFYNTDIDQTGLYFCMFMDDDFQSVNNITVTGTKEGSSDISFTFNYKVFGNNQINITKQQSEYSTYHVELYRQCDCLSNDVILTDPTDYTATREVNVRMGEYSAIFPSMYVMDMGDYGYSGKWNPSAYTDVDGTRYYAYNMGIKDMEEQQPLCYSWVLNVPVTGTYTEIVDEGETAVTFTCNSGLYMFTTGVEKLDLLDQIGPYGTNCIYSDLTFGTFKKLSIEAVESLSKIDLININETDLLSGSYTASYILDASAIDSDQYLSNTSECSWISTDNSNIYLLTDAAYPENIYYKNHISSSQLNDPRMVYSGANELFAIYNKSDTISKYEIAGREFVFHLGSGIYVFDKGYADSSFMSNTSKVNEQSSDGYTTIPYYTTNIICSNKNPFKQHHIDQIDAKFIPEGEKQIIYVTASGTGWSPTMSKEHEEIKELISNGYEVIIRYTDEDSFGTADFRYIGEFNATQENSTYDWLYFTANVQGTTYTLRIRYGDSWDPTYLNIYEEESGGSTVSVLTSAPSSYSGTVEGLVVNGTTFSNRHSYEQWYTYTPSSGQYIYGLYHDMTTYYKLPYTSVSTTGSSTNKANYITVNGTEYKLGGGDIVTSISSSSTDEQVPSAKCMYDLIGNLNTQLEALL